MNRKRTIIILIISTLLTVSFSAFLFTPYFSEITSFTKAVDKVVFGYQIGFGRGGQPDQTINGSVLIMIGQIAGMVAGVCSLIYTVWYIFSKKNSSFMMFLYCLCTPCLALAFTSIAISWPLYQALNSNTSHSAYYHWCYYVTIVLTAIAFFIDAFALVSVAIDRKKDNAQVK